MLARAIDSVLTQTYSNIELLVVDDNVPGSDESKKVKNILCMYNDDRILYVGQDKHINGAVARNEGIMKAKGKIIAFLDDDDEWLPEKIEMQMKFLDRHPEIGGTTCLYSVYKNGIETRKCPIYNSDSLQFKVLSRQISMYTSTFLCRKEIINCFGGFCRELHRNQDIQFFTDFLNHSKIEPITRFLVKLHEDSNMNRRGIEKTIQAKEDFFRVEKETIERYSKLYRKKIYSAHYFDIIINAIRTKDFLIAVKYLLKIGFSVGSYIEVINRYNRRKVSNRRRCENC